MSDRVKFISFLVLMVIINVVTAPLDRYIKPIVGLPSAIIYATILIGLPVFVGVGLVVNIWRKARTLEPEQRKGYIQRNSILLALLATYIVVTIGWQLGFR